MPLDLEAVQLESAHVEIEYRGHKFGVDYYPERLDGPMNAKIVNATSDAELTPMNKALEALVKGWDITKGKDATKGAPVPYEVTPENIAALPLWLKIRICNAIVGDVTSPQPPSASPDTSSPDGTTPS